MIFRIIALISIAGFLNKRPKAFKLRTNSGIEYVAIILEREPTTTIKKEGGSRKGGTAPPDPQMPKYIAARATIKPIIVVISTKSHLS
jgi:hypothetical protein